MNHQESMRAISQAQNDALINPRFYIEAVQNIAKSKLEGRPIFDDVEMCEISFAGNKLHVHTAPAHELFNPPPKNQPELGWQSYAQVYAPIYQRFKAGIAEQGTGTPLSEAPFLTAAKRSELMALNIKTIEALAALDGAALRTLGMGGSELKTQAQAYIDNAKDSAVSVRFAAENDELRKTLAEMQQQIAELTAARGTAPAAVVDTSEPSPFDDFTNEDIHAWLKDSGFPAAATCTRATLIKKANEANEELKKRKEAA